MKHACRQSGKSALSIVLSTVALSIPALNCISYDSMRSGGENIGPKHNFVFLQKVVNRWANYIVKIIISEKNTFIYMYRMYHVIFHEKGI